jgi:hypothetical protein
MKHISIGGLDVSRIGLGAMSMSGYYNIGAGSEAESIRAILRALDLGVSPRGISRVLPFLGVVISPCDRLRETTRRA